MKIIGIIGIATILVAAFMAIHGTSGWGWFLLVGFLLLGSVGWSDGPTREWNPANEPPDESGWYLCSIIDMKDSARTEAACYFDEDEEAWTQDGREIAVTHWKEIPSPTSTPPHQ